MSKDFLLYFFFFGDPKVFSFLEKKKKAWRKRFFKQLSFNIMGIEKKGVFL